MIDHTEWLNLSAVVHQAAKNAGVEFEGLVSDTSGGWVLFYAGGELYFEHDWKEESYFKLRDRLTEELKADSPAE